jgi:hypothetical protein
MYTAEQFKSLYKEPLELVTRKTKISDELKIILDDLKIVRNEPNIPTLLQPVLAPEDGSFDIVAAFEVTDPHKSFPGPEGKMISLILPQYIWRGLEAVSTARDIAKDRLFTPVIQDLVTTEPIRLEIADGLDVIAMEYSTRAEVYRQS